MFNEYDFNDIKEDCAILTACDSQHAPFLANAISSIKINFPDHPRIVIFDIGLSRLEKAEFKEIKGVELRKVPEFTPHWKINWSWKLYALTRDLGRYNLYLDLPNFLILRSLSTFFYMIKRNGYFLVSNQQQLHEITPKNFWELYGLNFCAIGKEITFGAGIIGYDRYHSSFKAIERAFNDVIQGLNLGRSSIETNKNYKPNIIRDCVCFRADQTVLNLAFRNLYNDRLHIYKTLRICGHGQSDNHPNQYLWYARRKIKSLVYIYEYFGVSKELFVINRVIWLSRIYLRSAAKVLRQIIISIKL